MPARSTSATPTLSRRQMLRTTALGAGVAVGGTAVSSLLGAAPALAGTSPTDFVSADLDLHLLRRATYGATPNLLSQVRSAGRNAWLDRQLAPASIDDSSCDGLIADRYPHLSWSIDQAWNNLEGDWSLMMELGSGGDRPRRLEQAAAVRGHGGLLVQPSQRHEPVRRRLVVPPRLRQAGDPQARPRPLPRHARGLRDAPGDDAVPQQRGVHEGQPERELRPGAPGAAHGRRGRRLLRGGHAPVHAGDDGLRHGLGQRPLRVRAVGALHGPGAGHGVGRREQPRGEGLRRRPELPRLPRASPVDGAADRREALPAVRGGRSAAEPGGQAGGDLSGAGHGDRSGAAEAVPIPRVRGLARTRRSAARWRTRSPRCGSSA